VLARVIFGARVSILFALMLTAISALIGIAAGALQGYYGGWVDLLGQRLLEVWSGLPVLYLLIILSGLSSRISGGCWGSWRCFPGWPWWMWCAPSSCAGATWNTSKPRGPWA
jgi:ABC-type dipeptide/oligopeptide/nickel transport system permease subunit